MNKDSLKQDLQTAKAAHDDVVESVLLPTSVGLIPKTAYSKNITIEEWNRLLASAKATLQVAGDESDLLGSVCAAIVALLDEHADYSVVKGSSAHVSVSRSESSDSTGKHVQFTVDFDDSALATLLANAKSYADAKVAAAVSRSNLVAVLGMASQSLEGLMSAQDKARLDAIFALDQDDVVNNVTEVLDIFSRYPEGLSIVEALAGKVDKVAGKGLSTEDYTSAEKAKLAGVESGAQVNTVVKVAGRTGEVILSKSDVGLGSVDNTSDADKPVSTAVRNALDLKVDKVSGKGLSTNDYTTAEKDKLAGIASGAEVNVQSDWNATSGDAFIKNKPTLGTAASKDVGTAGGQIPVLDGNGKLPDGVIPTLAITDTYEASSQTAMLGLSAQKGDICIRSDLNKSFVLSATPASTLANWKELKTPNDAVLSVAGKTGAVTLDKSDVGLGNVDNTSDLNKPISTATQAALDVRVVNPMITQGDMIKAGTNGGPVRMPKGTAGQVLKVNSSGTDVEWGTVGGGDASIEVVQSLPTEGEEGTLYLSETNAASEGGIVEFPVPTASDAGKVFGIANDGTVELQTPASGGGGTQLYLHVFQISRDVYIHCINKSNTPFSTFSDFYKTIGSLSEISSDALCIAAYYCSYGAGQSYVIVGAYSSYVTYVNETTITKVNISATSITDSVFAL